MDKRKLMHYSFAHSKVKHLGYHDGSHENPEKLATFAPRTFDADTYELVRRWNTYPELVEALRELCENGVGTAYDNEDDEVGYHTCCRVTSYKEHSPECPYRKAKELLSKLNP